MNYEIITVINGFILRPNNSCSNGYLIPEMRVFETVEALANYIRDNLEPLGEPK